MKRKDREMSRDFALEIADKCEYAVISMTDKEGLPYSIPVTIARDEDTIYFHSALKGTKSDILHENPAVCVVCVGDTKRALHEFTTEYESAIVQGTAAEVTEDAKKIHALRLICQRHTPANMDMFDTSIRKYLKNTAVWGIKIREITGKRNKKQDSQ